MTDPSVAHMPGDASEAEGGEHLGSIVWFDDAADCSHSHMVLVVGVHGVEGVRIIQVTIGLGVIDG